MQTSQAVTKLQSRSI